MKKLVCIFLLLISIMGYSQEYWRKSSPLDYSWKYVGKEGFAYGGMWWQSFYISLAFSPSGQSYVAFTDWENSGKTTVMKIESTGWVTVGTAGFSAGEAAYLSLAFNASGQPHLAFRDFGHSNKATVMKFDGATWINVGNAGFSSGAAGFTSLAFNQTDQPCIAYGDDGNSGKATVMKFDGSNWIPVGNTGFSAGIAAYTSLSFSPLGQPHVVFQDHATSFNKATAMKFDGTNWVNVGIAGFSPGEVVFTTLAFSPANGQPYVAFQDYDWANYLKATVMKFDGTNWVVVGNAGFSAAEIAYPSLTFSPIGDPYVAYGDQAYSRKATVMKFDGSTWLNVGKPGFSAGLESWENSIAFSPEGVLYIAYKDRGDADSCTVNVMKYDSVLVGQVQLRQPKILIYPNPATSFLTIDVTLFAGNAKEIEIFDVRGLKMLEARSPDPKMIINVGSFPPGIYLIRVKTDTGGYIEKFCKIVCRGF